MSEIRLTSPGPNTCLHFSELEAFGALQQHADSGDVSFSQIEPTPRAATPGEATLPPPPPSDQQREAPPDPVAALRASAATAAAVLAREAAAAAAAEPEPGPEPAAQRASPPRARAQSRHREGVAGATAPGRPAEGAAASGRAIEPDDFLWVVGAGSAYTLLMVVFQTIWIRSHWLSMWS